MAKAVWNGVVIAETDSYETVEKNIYFPEDSVKKEFLKDSETHTICPWRGLASYKTVVVDGQEALDAAWYYPQPSDAAANILGYFAFWKGVQVSARSDYLAETKKSRGKTPGFSFLTVAHQIICVSLELGACIAIDFHANGNFGDFRCLPSHCIAPEKSRGTHVPRFSTTLTYSFTRHIVAIALMSSGANEGHRFFQWVGNGRSELSPINVRPF